MHWPPPIISDFIGYLTAQHAIANLVVSIYCLHIAHRRKACIQYTRIWCICWARLALSQKMLGYEALFWHVEPNHATSWLGMATLFYTLHNWSVLWKLIVEWDFLLSYPAILLSPGTDCKYQFSKFLSLKISTLRHKGREMDNYSMCFLNEYTKETKYERNCQDK